MLSLYSTALGFINENEKYNPEYNPEYLMQRHIQMYSGTI